MYGAFFACLLSEASEKKNIHMPLTDMAMSNAMLHWCV